MKYSVIRLIYFVIGLKFTLLFQIYRDLCATKCEIDLDGAHSGAYSGVSYTEKCQKV